MGRRSATQGGRSTEMAEGSVETPVMDLLEVMTAASIEVSDLDARSLMLVRIAALIAMDAPPASYLLNLVAAEAAGIDGEAVRDVVAAIAPIVGTARTASAIGNVADALGFAELVVELQDVDDDDHELARTTPRRAATGWMTRWQRRARWPTRATEERKALGKELRSSAAPPLAPTRAGGPLRTVPTRWRCSRSRTRPVSTTWCRSGTGG